MRKGSHCSEETKKKLREVNIGKHHTEEAKSKMGHKGEKSVFFGKHKSEEHRKKISVANTGTKLSKETKQKVLDVAKCGLQATHLLTKR